MSPIRSHRATPYARTRLVAALLGIVLAASAVPGLLPGTTSRATAEAAVTDGSDWGSQGTLSSGSGVKVRWDNTGNPESSIVRRDRRQVIPHTDGKTYDDVAPKAADKYAEYFGAENGLGGLEVTVSQTQGLTNQAVTLDFAGAKGGTRVGTLSSSYFQVFQCAGDHKDDGASTVPDPATCQVGATGPDTAGGTFSRRESRIVWTDPLVGGDWSKYDRANTEVPFTSITGEQSGSDLANKNQFFNKTTTNEWSNISVQQSGTATREFEVQTSVEAPHLGCGKRADEPSSESCWLVVVPRLRGTDAAYPDLGPIAPSVWAQRLQVELGFKDIASGCPGGQSRALIGGSELLAAAAGSWTPGLCAGRRIALGYSQLSDEVARNQFGSGSSSAIVTSQPVVGEDVAHVPVALTAPVIALTEELYVECRKEGAELIGSIDTEEEARKCGFPDLAAVRAEVAMAGRPVRDIKLNARLVTKLLTQTYHLALIGRKPAPGWARSVPTDLAEDPEFKRLNPQLDHRIAPAQDIDHLIVEGMRSDAATQVWSWILRDPEGRAFLSGCPDADGLVVNPFYSTRTYEGCEDLKSELDAQAKAARSSTDKAEGYVDEAPGYPSDGSPYPLPGWQDRRDANVSPYTLVDHLPRTDTMATAGRNTFLGYVPRNDEWCPTLIDDTCVPAPGKWKDLKVRQTVGSRAVLSITDAATAAKFRLTTARLCDTDGKDCVGADTTSLRKAAGNFVDTLAKGVQEPGAADYAGGAYPLTLPVYAAISTTLDQTERTSYADALEYLTTTGQKPGFDAGDLLPGYAPLTDELLATAQSAIAEIRAPAKDASPEPSPSASPKPTPKPSAAPSPSAPAPAGAAPAGAPTDTGAPAAAPAPGEQLADAQLVAAPVGDESWPSGMLPLGIAIALLSGLAGPLLRLRPRFALR